MKNLRIHFSHPLLLLIFLLGAGITALLYFRLSKKYRKNRNRITSIVLHLVVLALAVLTLAGAIFTYQVPNKDNQIILLDFSFFFQNLYQYLYSFFICS